MGSVSAKRKVRSRSDAIHDAIAGIQKRVEEISEENRGLKRSLKKMKKKKKK